MAIKRLDSNDVANTENGLSAIVRKCVYTVQYLYATFDGYGTSMFIYVHIESEQTYAHLH